MNAYFDSIIDRIASFRWIRLTEVIRFSNSETDDKEILVYRLRLRTENSEQIEIMERIQKTKQSSAMFTTKYSVHWQTNEGNLKRRWDNAPHHPEISTHPHHIHSGDDDSVLPFLFENLLEILEYIDRFIDS